MHSMKKYCLLIIFHHGTVVWVVHFQVNEGPLFSFTFISCTANNPPSHPCRGICDVSHLPLPRDHPAEGHSSLFPAVWDMPLPLLRRQHQDRLPGCDRQEGAAPRQSQLKAMKTGLPVLSWPPFPPQKGRVGVGRPPWFAKRTLWIELREGLAVV